MVVGVFVTLFMLPNFANALDHSKPAFDTRGLIGQPYDVVRTKLRELGVEPLVILPRQQDYGCPGDLCRRYPEQLNCAGTGVNPCRFGFTDVKKGINYTIITVGDAYIVDTIYIVSDKERREDIVNADGFVPLF
jgi:hypothetical protein